MLAEAFFFFARPSTRLIKFLPKKNARYFYLFKIPNVRSDFKHFYATVSRALLFSLVQHHNDTFKQLCNFVFFIFSISGCFHVHVFLVG